MNKLAIAKGLILAVILAIPTSARAQAITNTVNVEEPIDLPVFVPCANGGAGDIVILSGTIHIQAHVTVDARNGLHEHTVVNFNDVSGVGLLTGRTYRGVGVQHFEFSDNGPTLQLEGTSENSFQAIGQGPGNNLIFHVLLHQTVNSNGDFTAEVVNVTADCK